MIIFEEFLKNFNIASRETFGFNNEFCLLDLGKKFIINDITETYPILADIV